MEINQLNKFFPTDTVLDHDTEQAIASLNRSARDMAGTLNTLLPESGQKMELIMRLFHVLRDAELSLKLDGPSRTVNMVIVKQ